jgi:hypothetical protein
MIISHMKEICYKIFFEYIYRMEKIENKEVLFKLLQI